MSEESPIWGIFIPKCFIRLQEKKMKVYYKLDNDVTVDEIIGDDLKNTVLEHILVKYKFKTMWALRSIEKEIEEEGGILIVSLKGIETKNFTPDLTEKIHFLLSTDKDFNS